jgi:hypothetical protein
VTKDEKRICKIGWIACKEEVSKILSKIEYSNEIPMNKRDLLKIKNEIKKL